MGKSTQTGRQRGSKRRRAADEEKTNSNNIQSPNPQPRKKQAKAKNPPDSARSLLDHPAPSAPSRAFPPRIAKATSAFRSVAAAVSPPPIAKITSAFRSVAATFSAWETYTASKISSTTNNNQSGINDIVPPATANHHIKSQQGTRRESPDETKNGKSPKTQQQVLKQDSEEIQESPIDIPSEGLNMDMIWKGGRRSVVRLQGKRQLGFGLLFLIGLGGLLLTQIGIVISSYHKMQCHLHTRELQNKLREWKRLVPTKHSDRNHIQKLESQIHKWRSESKAKHSQLVGVQQQCDQDFRALSQQLETKDCVSIDTTTHGEEVIQALQKDLLIKAAEKEYALQLQLDDLTQELEKSQQESRRLQEQVESVESKWFDAVDERVQAWEQVSELKDVVEDLETNIQEYSRRELKKWFGEGPYSVEFKMRFAQDQEDPNKFHYFVVELDADNMPHAVFTFLTLVDRGSFHPSDDGTHFSFHHNGAHIVSGSPMNHKDWNDLMLYQEYSENAPHEQYTMGWSALGPNLYFNLRDNNERDGNIRDPCFGRVVFGWSVVERMHKSTGSLEEESWKEMDDPVKVISIDFVRNN